MDRNMNPIFNHAGFRSRAGVCAALAIMIPVVTGCGSSSEEATTAATTAETASTETAETDSSTMTLDLAEGENALADEGKYYSESSVDTGKTIDWDTVLAETPDAIAWLYIPDTEIDCVVTSSATDTGAYLDAGNNTTFTDPQTVIHGSTAEGSALASIADYGDSEFFSSHPEIYLYLTDGQVLTFQVFASYENEHEDLLTTYDCYDYDTFQDYVNNIFEMRSMTANVESSLQETVIGTWEILTIQASEDDTTDFIVNATLIGTGAAAETTDSADTSATEATE